MSDIRGECLIVRGWGGACQGAVCWWWVELVQKMGGWAILQDHIRKEVAVRSIPGSVVL